MSTHSEKKMIRVIDSEGSSGAQPSGQKRPHQPDLSGLIVDIGSQPEGNKLIEVPVINARVGGKTDAAPMLVVSEKGSYIVNGTAFAATYLKWRMVLQV